MSIVLNEYEWAERAIQNHELGKKPIETLNRVSKYYLSNKYSKREVRRLLDEFMLQCDPQASLVHWSDVLDKVAKNADRYPQIRIDGIDFTLLCVAKYWDMVSKQNNHWVNTPDREIMQMANINTSIKRQSAMFAGIRDAGMIKFSKKIDNLNVQVTFIEPGSTAIHIQDFRNLGYQYLKYYGGPYFDCVNCGLTVKCQEPSRGRKQKYCPSCAIELHTKQKVDSVMRKRNAMKS